MSERVNDLRIWAKWARVVAGADELAKDLDRAADTIAALEREAKPVKFRWEASQCFAGQWRVGYIFDGANYEAWLIRADGMPVLVASTPTREGARTALEAEVLNQIYDQDWRMGFLAHTSDTAGEAAPHRQGRQGTR